MGITGIKTKNTKINSEINPDFYSRITWLRAGISDAEAGSFSKIVDQDHRKDGARTFINRLVLMWDATDPMAVV